MTGLLLSEVEERAASLFLGRADCGKCRSGQSYSGRLQEEGLLGVAKGVERHAALEIEQSSGEVC
ncbi:uncharacterized protein ColSpa_00147 [Colletotrichum spaethianum]|uniref:Uncharacterized protein n=1 Tax=Colletotrichum spaethianum TaxID=700344 RepID=A0AA37P404_9PEZI|nr:uncharacterized protein ColSpa_00147 [Colletotrichum spaethianum]GKT39966.1 hypothetical protein ColSpa_00147 [Colletotrichum spaethianum]